MENVIQMVKFTNSVYKFLSSELEIPTPKVKVDNNDTESLSAQFEIKTREGRIVINSDFVFDELKSGNDNTLEYVIGVPKLDSHKARFLFAILHELGHLVQYNKFEKWFLMFRLSPVDQMCIASHREYRETKIERNADKIAIALFNKYSDILLTKEKECAII
jgi:hypothetical protein